MSLLHVQHITFTFNKAMKNTPPQLIVLASSHRRRLVGDNSGTCP